MRHIANINILHLIFVGYYFGCSRLVVMMLANSTQLLFIVNIILVVSYATVAKDQELRVIISTFPATS